MLVYFVYYRQNINGNYKIKQYLNYIMIMKNQDIQVNLMIFLSQLKTYINLFPKQRKSQINNFTIARQTVF